MLLSYYPLFEIILKVVVFISVVDRVLTKSKALDLVLSTKKRKKENGRGEGGEEEKEEEEEEED